MASIRRKGESWQVVWASYVEGRRKQNTRNFATHADAKTHRAKAELLEQRGVGSARVSLGEYLADWLADKKREVEPNTFAGYSRWVGHIKRGHAASIALDRITPRDLEELYKYLLKTPARKEGRGRGCGVPLAPASVRHCHAILENALNDAVRHRRIDTNPAAYAKTPRGQSQKVGVPTADQVAGFIDDLATHNPNLIDLALTVIGTGLRRSEVLGLRFGDIDWAAGRITIRQAVIEHNGEWSIREGTKSVAGQRTISIAPLVVEALERQRVRVAEARLKVGRFWQDNDLLFPSYDGTARPPSRITKAFARACKRAGWPPHSLPVHSLRHAAATHSLIAGVDLAAISRRLGHSSPAVTARIYLSGDTERDKAAAEVMAGLGRRKARADNS